MHMYIYIYTYIHIHVSICVYIYICMHIWMHVCIRVDVYTHAYIIVYLFIHIRILFSATQLPARLYDPLAEEWVVVTIDDRLPYWKRPGRYGSLCFAKPTKENEFWTCLLEKAVPGA